MRRVRASVLVALTSLCCSTGNAQAPIFTTGTPAELERARSIGLELLQSAVRQPQVEIRPTRVTVDQLSMAHVRVQQFYLRIPVFGGEAIAHLRPDGTLASITDNLVPGVDVNVTPRLTIAEAIELARADAGVAAASGEPSAALWVFRRDTTDHLAYRIDFPVQAAPPPRRPVRFVDAHTGDILLRYDNLQTGTPQ